ncbi:hypothetical protein ABT097_33185 [Streptomyces sp. NPDC002225]|uniref:hypothetical protein n=1 Tax=Streptomyces sp. NPDC002225 TaxID=3154413 RepID=UPI00331DCD9D
MNARRSMGGMSGLVETAADRSTHRSIHSHFFRASWAADACPRAEHHQGHVRALSPCLNMRPGERHPLSGQEQTNPQALTGPHPSRCQTAGDGRAARPRRCLIAPTGFVFTGQPTFTYTGTSQGRVTGELDHETLDEGRILLIHANPHLNTAGDDSGPLLYSIGLRATHDAEPGVARDGSVSIGRLAPIQLLAKTTAPTTGNALRITQARLEQAHVRRGQQHAYPAVLVLTNTRRHRIGTHDIALTAPDGLRFTEDKVMMGHQDHGPDEIALTARTTPSRHDCNRTSILPGASLNLDPGKWAVIYPEMHIDTDAAPCTVAVTLEIGAPAIATGHTTITIA